MKLTDYRSALGALGDETRLRILNLLSEGELCVCDLMSVLREPQSKISRHLGYLRRAGLVEARKDGLWMRYRLSGAAQKTLGGILAALKETLSCCTECRTDSERLRRSKSGLVACCR